MILYRNTSPHQMVPRATENKGAPYVPGLVDQLSICRDRGLDRKELFPMQELGLNVDKRWASE